MPASGADGQLVLEAAAAGNLPLYQQRAKPFKKRAKFLKDSKGRTALHCAAGNGRTGMVEYLIGTVGCDVNALDDGGETALVLAASQACEEAALKLIAAGADVMGQNKSGAYPLHAGVASGKLAIVEAMVDRGAHVPSADSGGGVPLLNIAATIINEDHSLQMLDLLVKKGADPNKRDQYGFRALDVAGKLRHVRSCELLLPLTTPADGERPDRSAQDVVNDCAQMASQQAKAAAGKEEKPVEHQDGQISVTIAAPVDPDEEAGKAASREGDMAFVKADFEAAEAAYTRALRHVTNNHATWSNRAAARLRLERPADALDDARRARALKNEDAKAWFREGLALKALEKYEDAANAMYEACMRDEGNKQFEKALKDCVAEGREHHLATTGKKGEGREAGDKK